MSSIAAKKNGGRSAKVIISKKVFIAGMILIGLFCATLSIACIAAWKTKQEVKAYSVKVKKFEDRVDELIIEKEKIHSQRNNYIEIQGLIKKDGVIVSHTLPEGERTTLVGYYKVISTNISEAKTKDTLTVNVNQSGEFTLKIPGDKVFLSSRNQQNISGNLGQDRIRILAFLKNTLLIGVEISRPTKRLLDSLNISIHKDTLSSQRAHLAFCPVDTAFYDTNKKRYTIKADLVPIAPFIDRSTSVIVDFNIKSNINQ